MFKKHHIRLTKEPCEWLIHVKQLHSRLWIIYEKFLSESGIKDIEVFKIRPTKVVKNKPHD